MRDDLEFHIRLLHEVESNPVLYDHNDANYNNRSAGEYAWAQIGMTLNETGIACKNKWRNLRSTYIRYLHSRTGNRSGACPQKEYYLAPYFNFLKPFTKSRRPDIKIKAESLLEITDNSVDQICVPQLKAEDNSLDYETEESRSSDVYSPQPAASGNPASDLDPQLPTAKCQETYSRSYNPVKRKCDDADEVEASSAKRNNRDACELFLQSLVPRMQSMTESQQLSFQIGVMQLMQNIKYSTIKPDV